MALPASGSAAVTIGSNLAGVPSSGSTCSIGCSFSNLMLPAGSTATGGLLAPTNGVVVRWRIRTGSSPGTLAPRVMRPGSSATSVGVGIGEPVVADEFTTSTFPTRLPIQAGDGFGINQTGTSINKSGPSGSSYGFWSPPLQEGGAGTPANSTPTGELLVNADVEPDADNDGYGDETQDLCPTDPATQGVCPDKTAPETTITKAPKKKSRKGRVKIAFSSSEVGSTFACQLDAEPNAPCTSPATFHVSKGKHSLQVVATDAAGNADATPATAKFKRKRRR